MNITGINNGSLRELMANNLENLRNDPDANFLTSKIKGKFPTIIANKRGFTQALDYRTNPTVGATSPTTSGATANMVTTYSPTLDRMTANYQYLQYGAEVDNENIANSRSGVHVGPTAKALAVDKMLMRAAETEEWYFCRGDGTQTIGDITAGVSLTGAVSATLTLSGARDGAGAWFLRVGQRIRIYNAALNTLRTYATITAKATNGAVTILPDTTSTVVDTDQVLPEGDLTAPTTAGVKGLPYLVGRTTGAYFDKNLGTVPELQPIVDASTTTFTRTTMEYLNRRHKSIRNNGSAKTRAVTSPAQMSNYYTQFYAQNTAQVNIVGNQRPGIDVGASSQEYTFWGQPIDEYKLIHPKYWFNLDYSSFGRITLKDIGPLNFQDEGEWVQKIAGGARINAVVMYNDIYLEYFSPNPARNSAFTALTFSGLPLLVNDPAVG